LRERNLEIVASNLALVAENQQLKASQSVTLRYVAGVRLVEGKLDVTYDQIVVLKRPVMMGYWQDEA